MRLVSRSKAELVLFKFTYNIIKNEEKLTAPLLSQEVSGRTDGQPDGREKSPKCFSVFVQFFKIMHVFFSFSNILIFEKNRMH